MLRDHGVLPPVLPIVIYNGRGSWTAPTELAGLLRSTDEALAPYQPSQRYFLLDEASTQPADLPEGNWCRPWSSWSGHATAKTPASSSGR